MSQSTESGRRRRSSIQSAQLGSQMSLYHQAGTYKAALTARPQEPLRAAALDVGNTCYSSFKFPELLLSRTYRGRLLADSSVVERPSFFNDLLDFRALRSKKKEISAEALKTAIAPSFIDPPIRSLNVKLECLCCSEKYSLGMLLGEPITSAYYCRSL